MATFAFVVSFFFFFFFLLTNEHTHAQLWTPVGPPPEHFFMQWLFLFLLLGDRYITATIYIICLRTACIPNPPQIDDFFFEAFLPRTIYPLLAQLST